jgi:hypothetical protein
MHHLKGYMLRLSQTKFQSVPSNPEHEWKSALQWRSLISLSLGIRAGLLHSPSCLFTAHINALLQAHTPVTRIYIQQEKKWNIRDIKGDGAPLEKEHNSRQIFFSFFFFFFFFFSSSSFPSSSSSPLQFKDQADILIRRL